MPKLFQINSCITGSTGRIAQLIGEKAISQGWESWIAYSGRESSGLSQSALIPVGSMRVSQMHALQTRLFDSQGLGSKNATLKLIEQIESIRPDIIHLHNIHGYYINYPVLFRYLKEKNIPVVWTLHDCWAFTGHCVHFTDVDCFKWKQESEKHCFSCPKKKGYPSSLFLDSSASNYELKRGFFTSVGNMTLVPVSHWLGNVVAESFLGKYPIRVIQNGININTFYPRPETVSSIRQKYKWGDRFVILGVATGWSDDVGLHDFYRLREMLDERFAIAMVGLTPKQKQDLPADITGILRTSDASELAEIYTASDLFFNGSFQETFGLVTAEAMACGTKVAVYNSTACPEIVSEKTGYVLPVKDLDRLKRIVEQLAENPDRASVTPACVEYVQRYLNTYNKYNEYIELYNSLLNSHR